MAVVVGEVRGVVVMVVVDVVVVGSGVVVVNSFGRYTTTLDWASE